MEGGCSFQRRIKSEGEDRPPSPSPSGVSMKSEGSMLQPLTFKAGAASQRSEGEDRPPSPSPSGVSMKSEGSMLQPLTFKAGAASQRSEGEDRPPSPSPSGVSMKSEGSMLQPLTFKAGAASQRSEGEDRPPSPSPSGVSMKSEGSMLQPLTFKAGAASQRSENEEISTSPAPSGVSMKIDQSLDPPLNFKAGTRPQRSEGEDRPPSPAATDVSKSVQSPPQFKDGKTSQRSGSEKRLISLAPSQRSVQQRISSKSGRTSQSVDQKSDKKLQKKIKDFLFNIFNEVETMIIGFVKHDLEMFKKFLRKENTNYYGTKTKEEVFNLRDDVLNMTLFYLKKMKHEDVASALQNELTAFYQRKLKLRLRKKYQHVWEGISKKGESNILNQIYTDLYITESGGKINQEGELRQIQKQKTRVTKEATQMQQEQQIECQNMFEPLPGQDKDIRMVMTQGVAGIGKSICVQKFVLDWATDKKYQDISFIFPLPFRELNLKKENHRSLMDLISEFFPETKGLRFTDRYKVMFVLDGLDECRLPLAFQENETWRDASMPATLDVILTSLIKGDLLPSALIWITTRPAAAARIPADCVDRVAEVRGFNDEQKEEYFRKRISDESLANKIIKHVKASRSLFLMCHIPVFCWISATVFEKILEETENEETPKTLTEMYTCFLIFQTIQGNLKYTGKNSLDVPWDKEAILSLGKLAFYNLEKNNLIFYAADLEECGIDVSKISAYSGLCTQETSRFAGTVFSFVHLSIQEFIASLYAYMRLINETVNVFNQELKSAENPEEKTIELLRIAVDKALESNNGHLDLFLRFLLGLTVDYNQKLIRGLLKSSGRSSDCQKSSERSSDCQKEIAKYIKKKFDENPSPEGSINLFYCLNELNDDTLVKEIQDRLSSGRLSATELSPAQWSALVFVLLTSEEELGDFDLQKFIRSDECFMRLLQVVKESKRALLSSCNLTDRSCSALLTILKSESNLTEVDLSNNDLQDSGVELISAGLKNQNCKLEILRLSDCGVREEGYAALAEALRSNPSSELMELDLRGNHPGDSGVKLLYELLEDSDCKLKTLRLLRPDAEAGFEYLRNIVNINPLLQRELDLREKIHGDPGVKKISDLLKDPHCRTTKLVLSDCGVREEGYAALAEALKSNSSSELMELDLRGNDPGDSGVKPLYELLDHPESKLKTLRLLGAAAEEAFTDLRKVVSINLLVERKLDLSQKIDGDSGVKKLSELLKDPHCRPTTLSLRNCSITDKSCTDLKSALDVNPSHLKDLDLSNNQLGDSGVIQISHLLKNPQFKLHKLTLSDCGVREEGYAALAEALRSNPSSELMELDLRGNDPGDSGVKPLDDLVQNKKSKLNKLKLLGAAAEEAFNDLKKVVSINLLVERKFDLSQKLNEDSGVKKLSELLKDPHCRPTTLRLSQCNLTDEGCSALFQVLSSDSSTVRELDLSNNQIQDSKIKMISDLLNNPNCKLHTVGLSQCNLTDEGCSALFQVLSSDSSTVRELDLSNNQIQDSGVRLISDLLKNPNCKLHTVGLSDCGVREEGYAALAEALRSNPSSELMELDLRGNDPGDSGVMKLYYLIQDPNCKLKKMRLVKTDDAEKALKSLSDKLHVNPLLQSELDLSHKIKGDSGMMLFSALLKDPHFRPKKLTLCGCSLTENDCTTLVSALSINPSHLTDLDLSQNPIKDSGVKKLVPLLQNHKYKLERLKLSDCEILDEGYVALAGALMSNPHLTHLDLSGNNPGTEGMKMFDDLLNKPNSKLDVRFLSPEMDEACDYLKEMGIKMLKLSEVDLSGRNIGDSGVKHLSTVLKDPHCTITKLTLSDCGVGDEGFAALAEALKSNRSYMKVLDLRGNHPGESGVQKIFSVCDGGLYKLLTLRSGNWSEIKLRLLTSPDAEEAYTTLNQLLGKNILLQKKLDLSSKTLKEIKVNHLSALLEDPHCTIQNLTLCGCSLTENDCTTLVSALSGNPSHLTDLDLSKNPIKNSGVKKLVPLLQNHQYNLKRLKLRDCKISDEGYVALAEALKSNTSSPLTDLDLSGNNPGTKGMKMFNDLLNKANSKLRVRFLSPEMDEACDYLNKMDIKMLDLSEVDLSGRRNIKDSGVKHLSTVLKDPHCMITKLTLRNCSITDKSCTDLKSALDVNPSHLKDLDLSNNQLGDSGVIQISHLLKNPQFKLHKLTLSDCGVREKGYAALAEALRSNPSSELMELDLRENDHGDSGVKPLYDLVQDPNCKLKTLRFLKSHRAEEAYTSLCSTLGQNLLILTQLKLKRNPGGVSGDSRVKLLSAFLQDSHCKLQKLQINDDDLTMESCSALCEVLRSGSSSLRELDLSNNNLQNSGVQKLCEGLKKKECKLEVLRLSDCGVGDEGFAALAEALKLNRSHMKELDLRGNHPGESGVQQICDVCDGGLFKRLTGQSGNRNKIKLSYDKSGGS
ncbi:uncharacterized protein LOC134323457 [Trichomycterus rosablanca]|uniref:uncharacterized protein LOC134323457 n=1 Tax=Trichomycterus rosablanca TaxID=2290929 RepID=UPI002F354D8B